MPGSPPKPDDVLFDLRLARSAPDLWPMLDQLYGARPDYAAFRAALVKALRKAWAARPEDLKRLDLSAIWNPTGSSARHGGLCLLHRPLQRHLNGVVEKLDYLKDLGITYVHFMPCLKPRKATATAAIR
jgi:amylosucrase